LINAEIFAAQVLIVVELHVAEAGLRDMGVSDIVVPARIALERTCCRHSTARSLVVVGEKSGEDVRVKRADRVPKPTTKFVNTFQPAEKK
jgi:hypothetical protein